MNHVQRLAWLCAATALPMAAHADGIETHASATVGAQVGYSNNPFYSSVGDTGSIYGGFDVSPQLVARTERSTFTLLGNAHLDQYIRRYSSTDSYQLSANYAGRPAQGVSTSFNLQGATGVVGSYDNFAAATRVVPVISDPSTFPTVIPPTDIGLFGSRDRYRSLNATAGLTAALSARDNLSMQGYFTASRYSLNKVGDFNGYGSTIGYSRQIDAHLNLGVQGSVSRYDYQSSLGSTRSYSLQGTASGQISEHWSFNGALGASFVDSNAGFSTNKTSLSGNVQICRQGALSTMCASAVRQVSPTGFGITQYATSVGLSWTYRLDERSNLSLNGDASKYDSGAGSLGLQDRYLQASAGYDRQLSQRLRLAASVRYRSTGGGIDLPSDYGGQIGFSYRLGDLR